MVFLRVRENSASAFHVAICGFHFHEGAFALVSHHEINFKSGVFAEIIQFTPHFAENVGNKILEYCAFISKEVAPENVGSSARFEHTYK